MRNYLCMPDRYMDKAKVLWESLQEAEERAKKTTTHITGLPGGGGSDRNAVLASLIDKRNQYLAAYNRAVEISRGILQFILVSPITDNRKTLLIRRYIEHCSWDEIREKDFPDISERTLYREHSNSVTEIADWVNDKGIDLTLGENE